MTTAKLATDAVTAAKLADNAVVNASVDASAAIAGTKISPDFGSQAISTTGNVTIGDSIIHSGDTDTKIRFDTNDRFVVETAGVQRVAFGGVTTFNDSGADVNFRIEGDTDENLFFLDAGNNRVGIGTNNPNGKFVVASETSRTNDIEHLLIMTHTSSGTTTTGFGTGIRFQGERHNGNVQTIGDINYEADVNSGGNISAALVFKPSTNGTPTEKMRLASDGKLGVGSTTPQSRLDVSSGSDSLVGLRVTGGASGGTNIAQFRTNNGTERMTINNDVTISTGNLVIGTSGKGIDFSATANSGTSELFDDYEEGTWSALLNGGNFTATQNTFRYVKIGRQVIVSGQILNFSSSTNSSAIQMTGLPYTTSGQATEAGSVVYKLVDVPSGQADSIGTTASSNSTNMFFAFSGTGSTQDASVRYSDLNSTSAMFLFVHIYSV